jgi:hypothetical protein
MVTQSHSIGPCNQTIAWCPKYITRMLATINSGRNQGSEEIRQGTPEMEDNMMIMEPLCSKLLLCEEEGQEAPTSIGLLATQQMD